MDVLNLGFTHFDDSEHHMLFASDDALNTSSSSSSSSSSSPAPSPSSAASHHHHHHHSPAPSSPSDDDFMSVSGGSIASSSRCVSPAQPFESLPRLDESSAFASLRYLGDEAKYDADIFSAKIGRLSPRAPAAVTAAPAVAFSAARPALTVQVPVADVAEEAALVTTPVSVARRVHKVRPGTRVVRGTVAPVLPRVRARVVSGAVAEAVVVDAQFVPKGTAVPARGFTPEPADSVVSDESGLPGGRPRLGSISTSSMPGSPVCRAAVAVPLLGKRKASAVPSAVAVRPKRARQVYAGPVAMPASRLFLVYRGMPQGVGPAAPRAFVVADAADRISTVTVGVEPSCTCQRFAGGHVCDHLVFVFVRVLKASLDAPFLRRARLTVDELASVFARAPEDPAVAQRQQAAAAAAASAPVDGGHMRRRPSLVVRQGTEGRECSLCCEPFRAGSLSYCMSGCGTNFHQSCLERWQAYTARTTKVVAARVLSSASKPVRRAHPAPQGEPARAAEPLEAEPVSCPVCRCQWKDEDDHLEMSSPSVHPIEDMDSLSYASPLHVGGSQFFDAAFDFGADHLVL